MTTSMIVGIALTVPFIAFLFYEWVKIIRTYHSGFWGYLKETYKPILICIATILFFIGMELILTGLLEWRCG